jgi:DNA-binding NarL/FixJ family response regulator
MLTLYMEELTAKRMAEFRALLKPSLTLRAIDKQMVVIERERVALAHLIALQPFPFFESNQALVGLTAKERQVLELLAQGLRNRQIGQMVGISEKGVEKRVSGILTKLGLETRVQVIIWFWVQHKK